MASVISLMGIGIIVIPTGIIAAGFSSVIEQHGKGYEKTKEEEKSTARTVDISWMNGLRWICYYNNQIVYGIIYLNVVQYDKSNDLIASRSTLQQ